MLPFLRSRWRQLGVGVPNRIRTTSGAWNTRRYLLPVTSARTPASTSRATALFAAWLPTPCAAATCLTVMEGYSMSCSVIAMVVPL